jgi:glycosyltransferase involved in cell wall biosynthesis
MNKCKLSIIVPVYGVEKYIDKCLDSLVKQSLKEIEIIVVNDGTKDNSQKIIDKYVKKYPDKIKSYIKENGGQGSARNYGLKKTTGEYIGYVDSDDFVEKDMYKKLYNKAKENNYDIVVCGNYNVSEDYQNKNIDAFINNYNTDLENIFFGKMAVWNKIYKRDILIKNKLEFKEKVWYEDLAFTLKAIMNSNTFAFIDEPLYDYLIREGSTMNNSNVQRNLEILDAFNDILSYIQHNKKEEYFNKIEFLAIDHIYISAIVRVLKADSDKNIKKETIEKLINYMNKNFPNYKSNKYINTLSKNRKIIYKLINIKMYGLINLIFKVKKG